MTEHQHIKMDPQTSMVSDEEDPDDDEDNMDKDDDDGDGVFIECCFILGVSVGVQVEVQCVNCGRLKSGNKPS